MTPEQLKRMVFPGESGGDYNALFGYANRPGGQFEGFNLTDMTVDQALQFAAPSGAYGQSVRNQIGRVATPMGAFQVVGTTLRDAKRGLGLTGSERMTPELQDQIGMWIYENQGPGAWEAWGKSGGGSGSRSSGSGTMPMGLFDMQEEPQTFGERLKRSFQSGELMDRIALAANSLRMDPDPNLAQMIQIRQEKRGEKDTANRTAQWLMSQNRQDLAEALMTGALDAKTAVATALTPAADTRTAMIQNYEYWLSQGKTPQEAEVLARAGAGGTNVTTALPEQEKAYDKGMGEWAVKTYTGLQDAAAAAGDQMANLSRMESLMNDPNFRSGTGTDAVVSMQKLVEALGGNPADVGSIEAFRAASTQAVMAQLGGSLGAGFSNADRDFIMGMTANLDNSIPGNRMIIEAQKRIAQRKIELARLADEYIAKNGRLDQNWPQTMRTYAEAYPLFTSGGAGGGTGGGGGGPVLPGDMQYVNP
jgi:hypothetical protein